MSMEVDYMYENTESLFQLTEKENKPLWHIILKNEITISDLTEEEVFNRMEKSYEVMLNSAHKALNKSHQTAGNLISGISKDHYEYTNEKDTLCGTAINHAMAMALSSSEVNAAMGKICAAPTAGSCGILPAVLISVSEKLNLSKRETLCGLITASGIGAIIMKNATVSGAEGGCQAECGVAAGIAAAAAVEMSGGTPKMALNACSIAIINAMGIVCDPIAGLVQIPCAQRNASQTVNALLSADLALGGMEIVIPLDEVIDAMYKVGKKMPVEHKETALGGLASSPTAKKIAKEIFN